jgi:serine O-acetyltransferase
MLLLRLKEWTVNTTTPHPVRAVIAALFRHQSIKLGFSIPPNVFGPGLAIVHYGTIVVNGNARVGANCRLHVCVNIGGSGLLVKSDKAVHLAPQIGSNVYISAGVKIYGPVRIADGIAIGANAVVNRTLETPSTTIAGVPARVISNKGSSGMILEAD